MKLVFPSPEIQKFTVFHYFPLDSLSFTFSKLFLTHARGHLICDLSLN